MLKKAYDFVLFVSTTLTKLTSVLFKVAKTGFRETRKRQKDRRKRGKAKALLFFSQILSVSGMMRHVVLRLINSDTITQ